MFHKKMRPGGLLTFILWLMLLLIALVSAARGEDRALLIGVGRYAHFTERLNGVSLDLNMMTEVAQLMGFKSHEIKILEHGRASTARVYETIENWLIKGSGPDDRVLFYFSGHGSQIPDENDDEADQFDEVLLLYDVARIEKSGRQTLSGVLLDDHFNNMLDRMQSRNILVIMDACHSGSATRSIRLISRSLQVNEAKVKYFYYSPALEAAGGRGRFDVMEQAPPLTDGSRYVAITACRDDEKTVVTAQGSIFTLGIRQAIRSAAMSGTNITAEELQLGATRFIREQIRSDDGVFHPQIAGNSQLRKRPLQLVSLADGNGFVRKKLDKLVQKSSNTVWIKPNKACFEPGDVLELSVWIPEPGYLNIIHITADDQATVLFPNQYHPDNAVGRGKLIIPTPCMDFEIVTDGPLGPNLITAFLTRRPMNSYHSGFKTLPDVLAHLSPHSTRSLMLHQRQDWLAAGRIAIDIRQKGQCR
ncbi:MAG: caspase family protein [Desulfobacterales bacterium]|nr:MAG: caspase family protein [Desulfobacterales bacterium]